MKTVSFVCLFLQCLCAGSEPGVDEDRLGPDLYDVLERAFASCPVGGIDEAGLDRKGKGSRENRGPNRV